MIREITLRRFNAYVYVRHPYLNLQFKELAWYEAYRLKLLGTIAVDDAGDYYYMILGRDKRKVFRAIDFDSGFTSQEEATIAIMAAFPKYEHDGKTIYEQGDEKTLPQEFLKPQVPENKLHHYFKLLDVSGQEAARAMINEIVYSFIDVDGNYIKDFQTTGFDARLWELYIYVYLYTAGFDLDTSYNAPDYFVSYFGERFAIEAVTVNPSPQFDEPSPKDPREAFLLSLDYMPIKYGSSLVGKLRKKYWEKEHVKNVPLIIAIHDFHQPSTLEALGSMTWSRNALINYLYGLRPIYKTAENGEITPTVLIDADGAVRPADERIEWHEYKGKKIESGFFYLPDAENISAVLYSNNGTLPTFNRMGHLAGLGSPNVNMIRLMAVHNPDPKATEAFVVVKNINDADYEEAWGDGLVMYHNPRAKHPVDRRYFPGISHMYFDEKNLLVWGFPEENAILYSMTHIIVAVDNFDGE
ncbi:hypothetical protein HNQ91_001169 [Filimonas zeae]|uniref:Glycosaminoglycan attachment protein n=1 Tax=Filimonas zeae TaxID=1737353 RepID=A0A917IT37_9BACT|nr:hypothetical protein [Filimonas zeae]MDR6338147.1 hypothetical protein [Filimonas zeae]GGH61950.1 hypothetical protein GCM10011379_11430 [Filimonas zeae]